MGVAEPTGLCAGQPRLKDMPTPHVVRKLSPVGSVRKLSTKAGASEDVTAPRVVQSNGALVGLVATRTARATSRPEGRPPTRRDKRGDQGHTNDVGYMHIGLYYHGA